MFDKSMVHSDPESLALIPDRVSLAPLGEWPIGRELNKRPLKSEIDNVNEYIHSIKNIASGRKINADWYRRTLLIHLAPIISIDK